jgi:hypothetical protein
VGFGFACTHGYYPTRLNAASSPRGTFFCAMFPLQGSSNFEEFIDTTKSFNRITQNYENH